MLCTAIKFQNLLITPSGNIITIKQSLPFLPLFSFCKCKSFCSYELGNSWYFVWMESNHAFCVWLHSIVFEVHPYCRMCQYFIPVFDWMIICAWVWERESEGERERQALGLSINQLVDICFYFWLLWKVMLWTTMDKSFCERVSNYLR